MLSNDSVEQDVFVWKFVIEPGTTATEMPDGARLLHVAGQRHDVCVWAEVDPTAPMRKRNIRAIPTGGRASGANYVGTAHLGDQYGPLVFHVYEWGWVE